jgi:hypothetical protein
MSATADGVSDEEIHIAEIRDLRTQLADARSLALQLQRELESARGASERAHCILRLLQARFDRTEVQ